MPLNTQSPRELKGGGTTKVFDTFVAIYRRDPLLVGWPEANLPADERNALSRLLSNLSSLGRAEGWVLAELVDGFFDLPIGEAMPGDDNPVPVLCVDPLSAFGDEYYPSPDRMKLAKGKLDVSEFLFDCPPWHLCLDTETIHERRWSSAPGSRWVNYTRPAEHAPRERSKRLRRGRRTVARFLLDGPVLPLVENTVRVAEAFRRAVMSRFEMLCRQESALALKYRRADDPQRFASPCLSGKDAHGTRLVGRGHAHYSPIADPSDLNRLRFVTVFTPDGFADEDIRAMTALRELHGATVDELQVQLIGTGEVRDFDCRTFGPRSNVWVSRTPFLGHANIGTRGRIRYLRKGVRREWRRFAALSPELSGVELLDVSELSSQEIASRRLPQPWQFCRSRTKHGGREAYRPAAMFRLQFSAPVIGPLALGYASHFGMGQFVAAEGEQPRIPTAD
jgi:CRISPR-associated protein Csb2